MSNAAHMNRAAGLALATFFVPVTSALATDYIWIGVVDSAWDNPVNWAPPGVPGAGDKVEFTQNVSTLVDLVADRTLDTIMYSNFDGAYTLTSAGDTLTLLKLIAGDTDDDATHVIETNIAPSGGGAKWTVNGTTTVRLEGSLVGGFSVGKLGDGTLDLIGDSDAYLGDLTVGEGTLSVRGGNALSDTRPTRILSGATMILADSEIAGALSGAGDVFLGSTDLVIAGDLMTTFDGFMTGDASSALQHDGTGSLTMTGAGNAVGNLGVGGGAVVLTAGDLTVTGRTEFGASDSALIVDGATFSTGEMEMNGHAPTIRVSDPAGGVALTIGTNDGDSSVADISEANGGPGTVRKVGAGTLALTGDSTYSGGTIVDAGTLLVMNAAGSATGGGPVSVGSGARLGGTGAAGGATVVSDGGTVAPGTSAGTLTLGAISFLAGGDLVVEIGGTAPGAEHDQLVVSGSAALDGAELDLVYIDGFTANPGNSFVVLTAGALSGEFAAVSFPVDDLSWSLAYDIDDGTVTAQVCPDLNGSGAVDFGDILAILSAWGNAGGPEDLDGSGFVDFGDILVILTAWGPCP